MTYSSPYITSIGHSIFELLMKPKARKTTSKQINSDMKHMHASNTLQHIRNVLKFLLISAGQAGMTRGNAVRRGDTLYGYDC